MHCVLETAVEKGVDLVLFQEPPDNNKEYRPSHPGFDLLWTTGRVMSARRIDSEWDFTCEDRFTSGEAEGDVQVLAMRSKGKQERVC